LDFFLPLGSFLFFVSDGEGIVTSGKLLKAFSNINLTFLKTPGAVTQL